MASHTAKLRRHAESSGSNTLDESFVSLGTPLPSLSATTSSGAPKRDANEFLPVWQQEVRDEQGRRRLHGAFTGGFSAGYFNTVGSKEGWKPSQFKSSRGNKFAGKKQTAEDFMDAEDLEEMRNSKEFKTTSTFAGEQKGKGKEVDPFAHLGAIAAAAGGLAPTSSAEDEDVPSTFGADLVKPSSGRAGEKIMQKMGWKPGQGVGPRVSRRRRRQIAAELGITLAEDADEEEADGHLFAPPDRPLVLFPPRDTRAGLGYTRTHTSLARPASSASAKRKAPGSLPTGASFGLGALNDFEADDEDVYAPSSLSHSRTLGGDDLLSDEETPRSRSGPAPPTTRGFFRDGTPMLRNFSPATSDASARTRGADWFKPPDVPQGWEPDPQKLWREMERLRLGHPPASSSSTMLNADDRGKILGETQLPALPKSVFDFLSAKDRARLESIRSKPVTASAPVSEPVVELVIPPLEPQIAVAALKGFIPFAHDPAKQRRYVLFLQHSSHSLPPSTVFSPKPDPNVKGLEKMDGVNRELEAFKLSAEMFKPMSSAMAMRFTTASTGGQVEDAKAASDQKSGLHQPTSLPAPTDDPAKSDGKEKEEEELSTAQYAVRSGMFGHMTRKEEDWYPDRLVCKRFNVPDPHPHGRPKDRELPKSKMDEFLASQGFAPARKPSPPPPSAPPASTEGVDGKEQDEERQREEGGWATQVKEAPPRPLGQVGLGDDDENQGRETVSAKRPPMDLFKAIFGDGDDEESEADVDAAAETAQEDAVRGVNGGPAAVDDDVAAPPTETEEPVFLPSAVSSSVPKIVDGEAASASFASFRPTFKKKTDRSTDADGDKKREKQKKKRAMVITSFGADEGEDGEEVAVVAKERKRDEKKAKRRKKDRPEPSSDVEEMVWVEKEAAPAPAPSQQAFASAGARVARARAADLMDDE